MTTKLQLIILLLVFLISYTSINMIRKEKAIFKHMISWFAILTVIAAVTIFPGLIDSFSYIIGVKTPINAVFFMAILVIILIILPLSFANTKLSLKQVRLIQEVAILEKELRILREGKSEINEEKY